MRRRVGPLEADFDVLQAASLLGRRLHVEAHEAAALLQMDERTIRNAVAAGQLRGLKVGNRTLVATTPLRRDLGLDLGLDLEPPEPSEEELPEEVVAALAEVVPKIDKLLDGVVRDYIQRRAAGT